MNDTTLYESIIPKELYEKFNVHKGFNLFSHACNSDSLEDILAISHLLCPDFIKIKNYIFVAEFFLLYGDGKAENISSLEKQFNYDKTLIEKHVNSWSISDLFINCNSKSYSNPELINQFCEVLVYNWSRRLKELFPKKDFAVEIGDEIAGELGKTITVYERLENEH